MPIPARPNAYRQFIPGTVVLERNYLDLLGRPLNGTLTVAGSAALEVSETVIHPQPVKVELEGGQLLMRVPAGEYTVTGQLWNDDDETVHIDETVIASR